MYCLADEVRIGFHAGVGTVETELLVFLADAHADGHLEEEPDSGRGDADEDTGQDDTSWPT